MRRWNGWGDDTFDYPLPDSARRFLDEVLGPGQPLRDAALADVIATVPASRLADHPLICADRETRLRHARGQSFPDWVALRSGDVGIFPNGVAFPESEDDVRALLEAAAKTGARLIPYGGGTSVVGHVNPLPGDRPVLTVDLRRLSGLNSLDEVSNLATFGAGVRGPDLEAQLRAHGRTLGHFPQSFEYSTLGGWIATRSTGQQSLGYGRIEQLFAGGRVVAPAGTLTLPANLPASAAGPDLRELVLGSEGRLGIVTEATVRVSPLPEQEEFHAVFFPDFEHGRAAVREMLQARLPLSMVRLSTATETETTLAMAGHELLLGGLSAYLRLRGVGAGKCMMLFGATGRERIVDLGRREALRLAKTHDGVYGTQTFGKEWHKHRFTSPYLRNALWDAGYGIDTLETATDWNDVAALIPAIERAIRNAMPGDERVHVFTHISHLYPYGTSVYVQYVFRLAETPEETLRRWSAMKRAASETIVGHGATISHQHGVGVDHKPYLAAEKGALGLKTLQAAMETFDPKKLMNPGKLI